VPTSSELPRIAAPCLRCTIYAGVHISTAVHIAKFDRRNAASRAVSRECPRFMRPGAHVGSFDAPRAAIDALAHESPHLERRSRVLIRRDAAG